MRNFLASLLPVYRSMAPPRCSDVKPIVLPALAPLSSSMNVGRSVFQDRSIFRHARCIPGMKAARIYLNSPHCAASSLLAKELTMASISRCGPSSHIPCNILDVTFTTCVWGPDSREEIQYSYRASRRPPRAARISPMTSFASSSDFLFSRSVLAFSSCCFNWEMITPRRANCNRNLAFITANF
ncbi:MAG: hypothetical protein BWX80_04080 [Candidatus Hydrogenedentes bacterium ADurb.Bin101]|nr:MAG: hypothetical protein BWX80_04080 [Candidatus Hydrogenedentes bacterium ADurb.Bin101]